LADFASCETGGGSRENVTIRKVLATPMAKAETIFGQVRLGAGDAEKSRESSGGRSNIDIACLLVLALLLPPLRRS
jgi:hypothetical protein